MFKRGNISSDYLSRMITRVRVEGMSCQHCVRAVFTSLGGVEGITRADVSIGAVEVEHDERVTVTALRDAIHAHPTTAEGLGSLFSHVPPRLS